MRTGSEHQRWYESGGIVPDPEQSHHVRSTFTAINNGAIRVWACLLAGLIAGTTVPGAVAWEEQDRGNYNNKIALLSFLLESAHQRAGDDVQTLCLLISISKDVTVQYVTTNTEDVQIQQLLMAMGQDLSACLANQAEAHAWADS